MRLTDLVLCFPPIILAMAIAAALGIGTHQHHHRHAGGVVAEIRPAGPSLVIVQRSQEYVEAATVLGFGPARILCRHIMPERRRAAGRAGHARRRQRHHHLRRPVLPRPRRGAADAGMGLDGRRRAASWCEQWWVATFPGLAILTRRDGLQLPRRRHPRLARSEGAPPLTDAPRRPCRRSRDLAHRSS